jgi:hypothetical protein
VLLWIVGEQPDRPVAVPELERRGLVLALPVRRLDLEHDLVAGSRDGRSNDRRNTARERLAQGETPALDQAGVGQR